MEIATTTTTQQTISSREIAELTSKNHADVCRDTRNMLRDLDVDQSIFASVYLAGNGEHRKCYLLPKRECLILVSGYSVALRAKIIDRWAELERAVTTKTQVVLPDFSNPIAAARAWADEKEKNMRLTGEGVSMCFRDVASHLIVPEREMLTILKDKKIIYKTASGFYRAYCRHKDHFQQFLADDGENAWQNCRVRASGLDFVAKVLEKHYKKLK